MPDLERLVGDWRKAMLARCDGREDVVDELEAHLRDVIDDLAGAGIPAAEAFGAALDRLGGPEVVGAEFDKVPAVPAPWLPVRLGWAVGALLLVATVAPLAPKLLAGGTVALLAAHVCAVVLGYTAGLAGGCLAAAYLVARLFHDLRAGQKVALRRAVLAWSAVSVVLTGAGVVLGGYCPHEKTGWCLGLATHEVGGVGILAWGAVTAGGYWRVRRSHDLHRTVLLGVAGNVVILAAWVGTLPDGTHTPGLLSSPPIVAALVVIQLAVCLAAFTPARCLRPGRQ